MKNKRYNNIEEWANTLSHGIGILLGIVAGYLLLEKASKNIEPQWAVACVSVYLAGMLSSYVSSTWYHGSRPGKLKELLRKFDHGAIYLHTFSFSEIFFSALIENFINCNSLLFHNHIVRINKIIL